MNLYVVFDFTRTKQQETAYPDPADVLTGTHEETRGEGCL
jgi:hypothetical protein